MEFLKALLVGVIAALPVGPIFVMVLQRTLCHGRKAGVVVGLGAATADAIFATVSLLALSLVQHFVEDHQDWLMLGGGLLLGWVGFRIFRQGGSVDVPPDREDYSAWTCALQAFLTTLTNPAALAVMLALPALIGLRAEDAAVPYLLPASVGLGEWMYWLLVVYLLARFVRIEASTLRKVSRVAGMVMGVFGTVLLIRGIVLLIGS